jgi:hypothetical protein
VDSLEVKWRVNRFLRKKFFSVLAGVWATAGIATRTFGSGAGRIVTLRDVSRSQIVLHASAQPLDFHAWTKNPDRKPPMSHPLFPDKHYLKVGGQVPTIWAK